ncbi:MAG: lactate dehydrogenase [Rhodospirillales bacterium RIFCSPLOWO2_12_FULL_67_15]|nr:MAG: lactate dehydrogenase [Rhodospirillales bacterium RIFCSPLOWO2_12_FULL_67_15]
MPSSTPTSSKQHPHTGDSRLAARLKREIEGDVLFDAGSRGRYATDASIYQIEPVGVVVPKTERDAQIALQIALDEGIAVLARGAGTSQCGQTVGHALVIDNSKYLNRILAFDREMRTVCVQPGIVLDQLNAWLRPHGLWYPVDVSTSAQATLGGMAGNNSCGSRSIRYGNMVHNVRAIDAVLANGAEFEFGTVPADIGRSDAPRDYLDLVRKIRAIAAREAVEIERRFPKLLRRVGGYNLDTVSGAGHNMAHLLVGSEGTLAYSKRLHLNCSPLPRHKALGVCHFPTFFRAMEAPQHIIRLKPAAVELVDRTMIALARGNPEFKATVDRVLKGDPDAILLVEFAGDDPDEQLASLKQLVELMGDLGLPGSVVEVTASAQQRDIWEVRKAGLNIMMSMKGDGKPVSFIEDCAVPLEHLAEYTDRLTRVFEKHGTRGTWYAHASVGCLHVRPILNMRADGAQKMRAIAEEASAMVREYKGAYSGEHGDGLVRSEWIAPMFGPRIARAFEEIKALFDPRGLLNPGKIVRPPRMDDRTLFRYGPGYAARKIDTALDWSEWGGFDKAVEMCNNNGHCRKFDAGTMCPSFRATGDEQHLTRGRANTLRLALTGQLGPEALTSDELYATMDLCVSCKGCRRECPTGVDMAKMKIEFLHHYRRRHGLRLKDRLIAYLPRYAPWAARLAWVMNLRDRVPGLAALSEALLGFSSKRPLPKWRSDVFTESAPHPNPLPAARGEGETAGASHLDSTSPATPLRPTERGADSSSLPRVGERLGERAEGEGALDREVVLLVDTFNNYFEPENARAALAVLHAAGYRVHLPRAEDNARPLCCGRTFLAAGLVAEAEAEARRTIATLKPFVERGVPVIGLEPSCLLSLRDEFISMLPGGDAAELALNAMLLEEFVAREADAGRLKLKLKALPQKKALLHGHCHQKAFAVMPAVQRALALVPQLDVEVVESSCCGMAGSFGYDAAHYEVSMRMAEMSLLPKVRAADPDVLIVADGVSCRQQIRHGAKRDALHVARVLERALD